MPTGDTTAGTPQARYCSILKAHLPRAQVPLPRGMRPTSKSAIAVASTAGLHRTRSTRSAGHPGEGDEDVGHDHQAGVGSFGEEPADGWGDGGQERMLDPDPVQPTTKGPPGVSWGRSARCRWRSTRRSTAGATDENHSARKSFPASTHAARAATARRRAAWPGDRRARSASSTSNSSGRCRKGSRVSRPGVTSRSSQVTSARHVRTAPGTRTANLAPRRAASAAGRSAGAGPSPRAPPRTWRSAAARPTPSTPRCRRGSTCWSTRKRLDGAVRPDTMAATRTGAPALVPRTGAPALTTRSGAARRGGPRSPPAGPAARSAPATPTPGTRPGVLLVLDARHRRGRCAASGSGACGSTATPRTVHGRRRGAMTAFHSTTVTGSPSRNRARRLGTREELAPLVPRHGGDASTGSDFHGRRRATSHVTSWASAA